MITNCACSFHQFSLEPNLGIRDAMRPYVTACYCSNFSRLSLYIVDIYHLVFLMGWKMLICTVF